MDKPPRRAPPPTSEHTAAKPSAAAVRRLRFDGAHRPVLRPVLVYAGPELHESN